MINLNNQTDATPDSIVVNLNSPNSTGSPDSQNSTTPSGGSPNGQNSTTPSGGSPNGQNSTSAGFPQAGLDAALANGVTKANPPNGNNSLGLDVE